MALSAQAYEVLTELFNILSACMAKERANSNAAYTQVAALDELRKGGYVPTDEESAVYSQLFNADLSWDIFNKLREKIETVQAGGDAFDGSGDSGSGSGSDGSGGSGDGDSSSGGDSGGDSSGGDSSGSTSTTKWLAIYCSGYGANHEGDTSTLAFESWLGRSVDYVIDFGAHELQANNAQGAWGNYLGSITWGVNQWTIGRPVIWAIPIIPNSDQYGQHTGANMADAANNAYAAYWRQLAQAIYNKQGPGQIVRIGWEYQGDWYPWGRNRNQLGINNSVLSTATYEAYYKAAFQNIVAAFRSVDPTFKFTWNPNLQNQWQWMDLQLENSYPGDSFVDYVGLDVYEQSSWSETDATTRFNNQVLNAKYGLKWLASFGAQHGKRLCIPEWGVGQKGDNPTMIHLMADFIEANDVAWHAYWNGGVDFYNGLLDNFPNQKAAYKQRFGW